MVYDIIIRVFSEILNCFFQGMVGMYLVTSKKCYIYNFCND